MQTIGIFCGYYIPHLGGIERYVSKLSAELISRGYRVVVVTSNHDNLPDIDTIDGVEIYRLPVSKLFVNRYPIPMFLGKKYKMLRKDIGSIRFDYLVLNTRFHLTTFVGINIAKSQGLSPLLIEHGTAHFSVGSQILDRFGALYEHFLTYIIKRYVHNFYGVSRKCGEWLTHFGIRYDGVFYNAVDTNDELPRNEEARSTLNITYAGRLIKEKGVTNLIEAFESFRTNNKEVDIKLNIAGDGPLYDSILQMSKSNKQLRVYGQLNFKKMRELYSKTDIFIYPSLYPEGLPTSILEAGLMRCAVIATPRGGTEEVISDDSYGIIIDGSVSSILKAIEQLVYDKNRIVLLGNSLHRRITSTFTWPKVTDEILKELKKVKN